MAPKHPRTPDSDTPGPDVSDYDTAEDESSAEKGVFKPGPLPGSRFTERPVEMYFRTPANKAALLPYFALAFTPVKTDGTGELDDGINALNISFNAARNELRDPRTRAFEPLTLEQWRGWLASKQYIAAVKAFVESHKRYSKQTKEQKAAHLERLAADKRLGKQHLSCLLEVANEELGTAFQLGFITQGFWCEWDEDDLRYRTNVLDPTTARLIHFPFKNRPVIWIYNTNVNRKNFLHQQGMTNLDHWEGFAYNLVDREDWLQRRDLVFKYGIGEALEEDISTGVYILLKDSPVYGDEGDIDARAGSFLRQCSPPSKNFKMPQNGFKYMIAPNGNKGLVLNSNLDLVKARKEVPAEIYDPGTLRLVAKRERPYRDGQMHPFTIFRAVEALDKLGQPKEGKFHDGYEIQNGDLFYDMRHREIRKSVRLTQVISVDGKPGLVESRRLQVIENPWGLIDELPTSILQDPPKTGNFADLLNIAEQWGVKVDIENPPSRPTLFEDLWNHKRKFEGTLNLHRTTKRFEKDEVEALVPFEKGEPVIEFLAKTKYKLMRDIEGNIGKFSDGGLELVTSTAWNLKLAEKTMRRLAISDELFHPANAQ